MARPKKNGSIMVRVVPLLFFVVMAWVVISVVSTTVKLLYGYLALPLLVLALILNYSVVTDFVAGLAKEIKEDTGKGLIKAAAAALGYPFVFAYLALKAWMKRTLGTKRPSVKEQKKKGDYIKYEEVEVEEDFLELEDIDKANEKIKVKQTETKSTDTDYDDLFA